MGFWSKVKKGTLAAATGGISLVGDKILKAGARDAEKYDPNSENAKAARTFGGPNKAFDIGAAESAGQSFGQSNEARARSVGLADTINRAVQGQGPSAAGLAGQATRDSNLAQAAALTSGRRGQGSGQLFRMGMNSAMAGNLAAGQAEGIGRANEMASARGELGSLWNNIRSQDLNTSQLQQNNNQFNAGQRQNAALANQAAQLGIGQQEMAARLHQGDMEFSNLDPGSSGYIADLAPALGGIGGGITGGPQGAQTGMQAGLGVQRAVGNYNRRAKGGVIDGSLPRYASGGVIKIGERQAPVAKHDSGRELAKAVIGAIGAFKNAQGNAEDEQQRLAEEDDRLKQEAEIRQREQELHDAKMRFYGSSITPDMQRFGRSLIGLPPQRRLAKGGISRGPETALVGEAGPEVIVDIRRVVDRPTITTLGGEGRAQAVIPMNPHQDSDRRRVLKDIVRLANDHRKRS